MTENSPTDLYLSFTRRSLATLLAIILALGVGAIIMTLRPDGELAIVMQRSSWMFSIVIAIIAFVLQSPLRRHRFTPDSPEVKAVMNDELRRASMDRARKFAFIAVLVAQVPMALLLSGWPSLRALLAMAVATITTGTVVMISLFLVFDRE